MKYDNDMELREVMNGLLDHLKKRAETAKRHAKQMSSEKEQAYLDGKAEAYGFAKDEVIVAMVNLGIS